MTSKSQRRLVPVDGFFEPEKEAGAKGTAPSPNNTMVNRQLFLPAGLWTRVPQSRTGEEIKIRTVVAASANDVIKIHD